MHLLKNYKDYCDVYFLRSKEILQKNAINPWVGVQVCVRQAGVVAGVDEAVDVLREHSSLFKHGGKVYALEENAKYQDGEAVMRIEGYLQDFVEFETLYLGIISSQTTIASENTTQFVHLKNIREKMKEIVEIAAPRSVIYFGARHWHYSKDKEIAEACVTAGAATTSTQIGASVFNKEPAGTIPHALVLAYGDTLKATQAFDTHIDKSVQRVALVDTFNQEITDSLRCAKEIPSLNAVRLDTAGENYGESCIQRKGKKYWQGKGVTVELAVNTRRALDKHGFKHAGIFLSSGFTPEKTAAFVEAEKKYGTLFAGVGTGSLFPAELRMATADIVMKDKKPYAKTGREYRQSARLQVVDS